MKIPCGRAHFKTVGLNEGDGGWVALAKEV